MRPWLLCLLPALGAPAQALTYAELCEQLHDLDRLTRRQQGVTAHQASSYERRDRESWGVNGDSGHYARVEPNGEAVLFQADGPGCIWRIWSANPQGLLRFYFDGAATPSLELPFQALFEDGRPPFIRPLVYQRDTERSAHDCYVPLPFAKSVKVTADAAHRQYYHFDWLHYPAGTTVPTFRLPLSGEERDAVRRAAEAWANPAGIRSRRWPANRRAATLTLQPARPCLGGPHGPGQIRALRVRLDAAQRFAGASCASGRLRRVRLAAGLEPARAVVRLRLADRRLRRLPHRLSRRRSLSLLRDAVRPPGATVADQLPGGPGAGRLRLRLGAHTAAAGGHLHVLRAVASGSGLDDVRLPLPRNRGPGTRGRDRTADQPPDPGLVGRGRREDLDRRRDFPGLDRHRLRRLLRRRLGHPLPPRAHLRLQPERRGSDLPVPLAPDRSGAVHQTHPLHDRELRRLQQLPARARVQLGGVLVSAGVPSRLRGQPRGQVPRWRRGFPADRRVHLRG